MDLTFTFMDNIDGLTQYDAAGLTRRQAQKCHNIFKIVKIIELHYYI